MGIASLASLTKCVCTGAMLIGTAHVAIKHVPAVRHSIQHYVADAKPKAIYHQPRATHIPQAIDVSAPQPCALPTISDLPRVSELGGSGLAFTSRVNPPALLPPVVGGGVVITPPPIATPVPEPSTWLTGVLAFGIIGMSMRRRPLTNEKQQISAN